jgi:hypothetical protein
LWKSTKKVHHGSERRKRRPKQWNRKSPGCQLKIQRKKAANESCSAQKMRGCIQQKEKGFCARRKCPLTCRKSHTASTGQELKPSFQGLTLKKGKLDLKGAHKKRAERREAYEAKLQPEVVGATTRAPPENLMKRRSPTDTPSIGNEIHKSLSKETDEASESPRSQRCAR